ncbi:MAG: endonuclease/exonuclease/phosphatase family protein [Bacteroidota bacterium]
MNRSFFLKFLLFINLMAVIGLLASYCAGYISPEKFWFFAFFGLAYPVLLIINLVFVTLWLIMWKRFIFLSLISILVGWNSLLSIYPFHFSKQTAPTGLKIKVVSFNVHSLYGSQRAESIPETRSKVTEFLAKQKGDIICIQEFFAIGEDFSKTLTKFTKSIQLDYYSFKNYKDFWNKRKINAIATFSRYPILNSGHFKLQDGSLFALFSDILIKKDTIRVYNLHLESVRFGNDDYSFYSRLTDPDTEGTPLREGSKRMIWKLRKSFILRSKQVHNLATHIAACPYPVILAGDFNDTPTSYTYHQLTIGLFDSFKEAGNELFEGTYAGKLPSFRIDYILHTREFQALTYKKIDVELSDHYPITATMAFNH